MKSYSVSKRFLNGCVQSMPGILLLICAPAFLVAQETRQTIPAVWESQVAGNQTQDSGEPRQATFPATSRPLASWAKSVPPAVGSTASRGGSAVGNSRPPEIPRAFRDRDLPVSNRESGNPTGQQAVFPKRYPVETQTAPSIPPGQIRPAQSVLRAPRPEANSPVPPASFHPSQQSLRPPEFQETDLVQSPRAENQVNANFYSSPDQANRDQFWRQFSTVPPDDPRGRTKGYGSLPAVLNNGFWFAGVDILYFEPMYQGNNAFSRIAGTSRSAEKVDFGFDTSFRGYFGFETNAGPAIKFSFTRMNEFSSLNQFLFAGGASARTSIDIGSPDQQIELTAGAGPGARLALRQQLKINSTEIMIYKDQKNPVSRVRGNIGLRHVSLQQKLFAGLDGPFFGSRVARNFNDYFGVGPKLGIEYFRPIGHTDLEFQSGMFGSLLFGRRDQTLDITGVAPVHFRQIGKIEPLTIFEMYLGVQWNFQLSKCQKVFLRTAIESQLWAGSDSALDIGGDMGLYGMTFGFGVTR